MLDDITEAEPSMPPTTVSPTSIAADAELVSSSTDKPSGWTRLPLELREKVVDDVVQVIEDLSCNRTTNAPEAVAVGFFEVESARSEALYRVRVEKRRALERMQAVGRDFRSLCTPHLWRDIIVVGSDPSDQYARQVERLFDDLPSHASHVRSFMITRHDQGRSELAWDNMYEQAMQALRLCKNVRRVELYCTRRGYPDFEMPRVDYMELHGPTNVGQFLQYPVPANLTSLKLCDNGDEPWDYDLIAPVILLSSLKHLYLRMGLEDSWFETALEQSAGVDTVARLESLELNGTSEDISYSPLHAFVSKFASSLASLRLFFPPSPYEDPWTVPVNQAFDLPHLHSLFLSTGFTSDLFLQFTAPHIPLRLLYVGYSPFLYGDVDGLVILLRAHAATLERVHIAAAPVDVKDYFWHEEILEEHKMSLEDYVDLTYACRSLGVAYSIEEPEDYIADDETVWDLPSRYYEDSEDAYGEFSTDEYDEDTE
ncbi:hypothetical protein JCM8208_006288 [Rhodotorula glutinis]